MKNDRNAIYDNYNNIVDALKEYGMWDELNSSEKTRNLIKMFPICWKVMMLLEKIGDIHGYYAGGNRKNSLSLGTRA